jgi:hypothetical protein
MYKMGYFRENLHTKQKTSRKNPSTSFAGSPPLKGRLILGSLEKGAGSRRLTEGLYRRPFTLSKRFHIKIPPPPNGGSPPFSREAFYSGSPLLYYRLPFRGAGSRRLTEGYFHKPFTLSKRFHENPSTSFAGYPPLKGRLILGSLEKGAGSRRLTEGLYRRPFTLSKRFHIKIPPPPNGGSPPFSREAFYSGSPERGGYFKLPKQAVICRDCRLPTGKICMK